MSSPYKVMVEIEGYRNGQMGAIRSVLERSYPEFEFPDLRDIHPSMELLDFFGQGARKPNGRKKPIIKLEAEFELGRKQLRKEFVRRMIQRIWRANAEYCIVLVRSVLIEDLPYVTDNPNKDDYEEWVKASE